MDTETGEIFDFKNIEELFKAQKKNPNLVEVNCDKGCDFRIRKTVGSEGEKTFCIANRSQRRRIKCQIKKEVRLCK